MARALEPPFSLLLSTHVMGNSRCVWTERVVPTRHGARVPRARATIALPHEAEPHTPFYMLFHVGSVQRQIGRRSNGPSIQRAPLCTEHSADASTGSRPAQALRCQALRCLRLPPSPPQSSESMRMPAASPCEPVPRTCSIEAGAG
jgi:hypothetical protein